ncbi:hypothetical protein FNN08_08770 [Thalassomonas sp. M1454]|nr:hypothetical protein FNN08_08770 [Thalassomonas sp. M1454]
MDGSSSYDDDNDSLSYQWSVVRQPQYSDLLLNGDARFNPNFTADVVGQYEIELKVFDGKDYSLTDSVLINAEQQTLDCNALDPNKIYLLGTLQENTRYYGIVDPSNPHDFCVGLIKDHLIEGQIASTGRYLYSDSGFPNKNFYAFMYQEISRDDNGYWVYPDANLSDEVIIHTAKAEGCGFSRMLVVPGIEELVYSCPNRTFYDQTGNEIYDTGTTSINRLLAVFPDGGLLVFTAEKGIIYVDANLDETVLNMPYAYDWTYYSGARQFIAPESGDTKVWLAYYKSNTNVNDSIRLTINLSTMEVLEDGYFSDMPSGYNADIDTSKLDLEGNLWQIAYHQDDRDKRIIVKRPVASSGRQAKVIYNHETLEGSEIYIGPTDSCYDVPYGEPCDDDLYHWEYHDNLFLKIDGFSYLITGS